MATATNTNTGETHEIRSGGVNMERNIERQFGVRFASHTVDAATKTVTYTTTNAQTIAVRFA